MKKRKLKKLRNRKEKITGKKCSEQKEIKDHKA